MQKEGSAVPAWSQHGFTLQYELVICDIKFIWSRQRRPFVIWPQCCSFVSFPTTTTNILIFILKERSQIFHVALLIYNFKLYLGNPLSFPILLVLFTNSHSFFNSWLNFLPFFPNPTILDSPYSHCILNVSPLYIISCYFYCICLPILDLFQHLKVAHIVCLVWKTAYFSLVLLYCASITPIFQLIRGLKFFWETFLVS